MVVARILARTGGTFGLSAIRRLTHNVRMARHRCPVRLGCLIRSTKTIPVHWDSGNRTSFNAADSRLIPTRTHITRATSPDAGAEDNGREHYSEPGILAPLLYDV